jgi:DNA-directed RNA polymerase subunit K/omega
MDTETIKILILEKIINVFAPKITGYYIILNRGQDFYTWIPNFNYIEESFKDSNTLIDVNIYITMDKANNFVSVRFRKVTQTENYSAIRHTERQQPEIIEFIFKNTKTAIREISKLVNVAYLTKIGISAMNEIENFENPENLLIGSIKKILDINPNIDLLNLNTRKVLLEKITNN